MFFGSENHFTNEESIFSILKEEQSMYDIIIQFLYDLHKNQEISFCYVFPFQKNTFYFWNHEKLSWDKITQQILKHMETLEEQSLVSTHFVAMKNVSSAAKYVEQRKSVKSVKR